MFFLGGGGHCTGNHICMYVDVETTPVGYVMEQGSSTDACTYEHILPLA